LNIWTNRKPAFLKSEPKKWTLTRFCNAMLQKQFWKRDSTNHIIVVQQQWKNKIPFHPNTIWSEIAFHCWMMSPWTWRTKWCGHVSWSVKILNWYYESIHPPSRYTVWIEWRQAVPSSIPRDPPQTEMNLSENFKNWEQRTRTNSSTRIEIDDWFIM